MNSFKYFATFVANLRSWRVFFVVIPTPRQVRTWAKISTLFLCLVFICNMLAQIDSIDEVHFAEVASGPSTLACLMVIVHMQSFIWMVYRVAVLRFMCSHLMIPQLVLTIGLEAAIFTCSAGRVCVCSLRSRLVFVLFVDHYDSMCFETNCVLA